MTSIVSADAWRAQKKATVTVSLQANAVALPTLMILLATLLATFLLLLQSEFQHCFAKDWYQDGGSQLAHRDPELPSGYA